MGCTFSSKGVGQPAAASERHTPASAPAQSGPYVVQCQTCGVNMASEVPPESGIMASCPACTQMVHLAMGQLARRSRGAAFRQGHPAHNLLGGRGRPVQLGAASALNEVLGEKALQEAIIQSQRAHLANNLPREKYNSQQHRDIVECELCLEEYKAGDELMRLPCMHAFHASCVSPWLQKAGSCPVCQIDACQALG